jgi:hypothetical protein
VFDQGNVTQTLVHELSTHVQGELLGQPNADGHLSKRIDDQNAGRPVDYRLVLTNPQGVPTSSAPFDRSLNREREALANLYLKYYGHPFSGRLGAKSIIGGDPDKRQSSLKIISWAENLAKQAQPAPGHP